MIRWGILSTAKIGIDHVIPAILKSDNGVVSAIASRSVEKAQAVAERFGAPHAFGSYEEMLASDAIDAVYIPLITSQHVEWSIKAADAGKHVLCEKPIALHADQIHDIIAARDRNKVLICEAFMVTYHPQWHKVRSLITNGAIGKLAHVQGAFSFYNDDADNMRNIVEQGGGALPDIGVYPTVTTRFATGQEPISVSATVERDKDNGTDIYASWRARFEGFEMSAYISTKMGLRQEMSFHGDKGWIELSAPFNACLYDADTVTAHNQDKSESQVFRFSGVDQYTLQAEAFGRAVQGKKEEMFTLENSVKNQKVIDAIYRAGTTDAWEKI